MKHSYMHKGNDGNIEAESPWIGKVCSSMAPESLCIRVCVCVAFKNRRQQIQPAKRKEHHGRSGACKVFRNMHVVLKVPCYNRETTHFEGGILDETETNTKTPTGSWESLPQPRKIPPLPFYRSHGRPSPRVVLGTSYLGIQGICRPSPFKKSNKPVLMGYQGTHISGWAQPGEISLGSPAVRPSNSSATLCKVSARHTCRPAQSRSKKRARAFSGGHRALSHAHGAVRPTCSFRIPERVPSFYKTPPFKGSIRKPNDKYACR